MKGRSMENKMKRAPKSSRRQKADRDNKEYIYGGKKEPVSRKCPDNLK